MLTPLRRTSSCNLGLQLLTGTEYLNSLSSDIAEARRGDRILIATMSLDSGEPLVADVMTQLYLAAERGADVLFGLDAYGLMRYKKYAFLAVPWATNKAGNTRLLEALDRLASYETGSYGFTNVPSLPFSNLLAGRSHIKVSIVRNRVYLGGVNFRGAERLDMMMLIEDEDLANWLYDMCRSIIEHGTVRRALGRTDLRFALDDDTDLLLDVGRKRRSINLQEAISIIDEAMEWLAISCQFLPYGIVANRIEVALERGVELDIYTNHVSHHGSGLISLAHRLIDTRQRKIRPPQLFSGELGPELPSMHAKIAANEKRGLGTSINMVTAGVTLGTAELGIARRTADFGHDLRALLDRLVSEATAQLQTA